MDTTPAGRLRSEGRRDKPARPHHKDEPQNYKGNNSDSNEYRSDSFHHAPYRDYPICLQSPPQSRPPVRRTPGTLASSGGAKVLFIGGLQTPDQPQSCPSRAAHQAGPAKLRAATICLICARLTGPRQVPRLSLSVRGEVCTYQCDTTRSTVEFSHGNRIQAVRHERADDEKTYSASMKVTLIKVE
jgi:hypothetical protein